MALAFWTCIAGMTLLYVTLWKLEMTHKNARFKLRAVRRRLGGGDAVARRSAAPRVTAQ